MGYIFILTLQNICIFETSDKIIIFGILLYLLEDVDLIQGSLEFIVIIIIKIDDPDAWFLSSLFIESSHDTILKTIRINDDILIDYRFRCTSSILCSTSFLYEKSWVLIFISIVMESGDSRGLYGLNVRMNSSVLSEFR